MTTLLILAAALVPGPIPSDTRAQQAPVAPKLGDQGTFVLTFAGREYGTENFSIRSAEGRVEAEAEIHLRTERGGHTVEYQLSPKLVMDAEFHPQTYSWRQKGSEDYQLQVDFRASPAKSELQKPGGQKDIREFTLPKDVVILDDNVVHHYQLLADRYAQTPGGKQTFQAYIPQEAVPGVLTVQEVGQETGPNGEPSAKLRHLVVSTEASQMDLWVDASGRLERVSNASGQLVATRKP